MFYTIRQNNSGGEFIVDENVAHYVCIEADSEEEAQDKALDIGIYFDGCESGYDCSCCGDRWYWSSLTEARERPHAYGVLLEEWSKEEMSTDFWFDDKIVIHFKDGTKQIHKMVDVIK